MENADYVIETIDATHRSYSYRGLALFLCACITAVIPWFMMRDLFQVPQSITSSRTLFAKIKSQYAADSEKWIQEKNQLLEYLKHENATSDLISNHLVTFKEIPIEVLFAYLFDDLGFSKNNFLDFAITPGQSPNTFFLSKVERQWPFTILNSLECRLTHTHQKWEVEILSLQRGTREIDTQLVWSYFSEELNRLLTLNSFAVGTELFAVENENWQWQWRPTPFASPHLPL